MYVDDIGMAQQRDAARLAHEHLHDLAERGLETRRIDGDIRPVAAAVAVRKAFLDDHGAFQTDIVGQISDPKAAAADFLIDAEFVALQHRALGKCGDGHDRRGRRIKDLGLFQWITKVSGSGQ